jgi:hypothetical protein
MGSYGGVTLQHGQCKVSTGWITSVGEKCPSSIPGDFAERQDIALTVSRLYFTCYLSSSVFLFFFFFLVMLLVAAISSFCPPIRACDPYLLLF